MRANKLNPFERERVGRERQRQSDTWLQRVRKTRSPLGIDCNCGIRVKQIHDIRYNFYLFFFPFYPLPQSVPPPTEPTTSLYGFFSPVLFILYLSVYNPLVLFSSGLGINLYCVVLLVGAALPHRYLWRKQHNGNTTAITIL